MTAPALLAGLLLTALSASGADLALQFDVRPATTTAALGVPLAVSAVVRSPSSFDVVPDLEASTTDSYAITKAEALGESSSGPTKERRFVLEVLPLDIGKIPVRVLWTVRGAAAGRAESPAFTLDVPEPDLGKDPQLRDIKALLSARAALWPWLLLAALLAAAYWLWRRSRAKPGAAAPSAPPDDRPPHIIAQDELDALQGEALWEQGRHKEFYIRLTDILRTYLERRYGVPALQLTTTELSRDLRSLDLERVFIGRIKDLFDRADLVKFAKWRPEEGLGAQELTVGREVVRDSAPKDLAGKAS
jgi:hypothetical protein